MLFLHVLGGNLAVSVKKAKKAKSQKRPKNPCTVFAFFGVFRKNTTRGILAFFP